MEKNMKRVILLTIPLIFLILISVSNAVNIVATVKIIAAKPSKPGFSLDKIIASAFDFSPNSIKTLNGINIYYLEYGRADAYVTEVNFPPWVTYIGTLKFAARGLENGRLFTVTVSSVGPLYCTQFTDKKLDCVGKGKLVGGTTLHPGPVDLSKFEFIADKNADTISVYAKDIHGKTVLNAQVEDWNHRVPQKPITFVYYASTFS